MTGTHDLQSKNSEDTEEGIGVGHSIFWQQDDDEEDLGRDARITTPSTGSLSPNHQQPKKRKRSKKSSSKGSEDSETTVVVQSVQYQMKELAGLDFKKIEDFEFALTQLRISGASSYKVATYINPDDQNTIDVMIPITPKVEKLIKRHGLSADWRTWPEGMILKALKFMYPKKSAAAYATTVGSIADQLKAIKIVIN